MHLYRATHGTGSAREQAAAAIATAAGPQSSSSSSNHIGRGSSGSLTKGVEDEVEGQEDDWVPNHQVPHHVQHLDPAVPHNKLPGTCQNHGSFHATAASCDGLLPAQCALLPGRAAHAAGEAACRLWRSVLPPSSPSVGPMGADSPRQVGGVPRLVGKHGSEVDFLPASGARVLLAYDAPAPAGSSSSASTQHQMNAMRQTWHDRRAAPWDDVPGCARGKGAQTHKRTEVTG
jgi:hypothetical protein